MWQIFMTCKTEDISLQAASPTPSEIDEEMVEAARILEELQQRHYR